MSTWLEKGEVPDSDDDENWDSQSTDGGVRLDVEELRETETKQDDSRNEDTPEFDFRELRQRLRDESPDPLSLPYSSDKQSRVLSNAEHDVAGSSQSDKASPEIHGDAYPFEPLPTPEKLSEFSKPTQYKAGETEVALDNDEISRSYVILSSPLSSVLSSPPQSPPRTGEVPARVSVEDIEGIPFDSIFEDDFATSRRRNLRERAPIQLHPFALEQEKYRRTMQGRGVKPLRVEHVREQSLALNRESQDGEFSAEDSNMLGEFEEDTQMLSSSAPQSDLDLAVEETFEELPDLTSYKRGLDDDDLPDIAELVNHRKNVNSATVKRRKIGYGSNVRLAPQRHGSGLSDVWNVPNSPPKTSSPHPGDDLVDTNHATEILDNNTIIDSSPPAPFRRPAALPTPATSATRIQHVSSGHAENNDPFSDAESVDTSTSTNEVIEVKRELSRVGKRIKGVLPASWMRLDQQGKQGPHVPTVRVRGSRSLSPDTPIARRGVAVPKTSNDQRRPMVVDSIKRNYFLSDEDSSSDDDNSSLPPLFAESHADTETNTDLGAAFEDDRIDAMLPLEKRQTRLLPGFRKPRHMRKPKDLFGQGIEGSLRQPKITDQFASSLPAAKIRRQRWDGDSRRSKISKSHNLHRIPKRSIAPPRLSILDVLPEKRLKALVPAFLRIAARNSRKQNSLGRQSPTRKFIRLDNREDTVDAQERLLAWRDGFIQPQPTITPKSSQHVQYRPPLHETSHNILRSRNMTNIDQDGRRPNTSIQPSGASMDLEMAQGTQTTCSVDQGPQFQGILPRRQDRMRENVLPVPLFVRPAQLETVETDYQHTFPNVAFRSNKKALDVVYKRVHSGSAIRGDLQLAKFLYDDDPVANPDFMVQSVEADQGEETQVESTSPAVKQVARKRKRSPKRIDAGAAKYRQPEQLIVNFLKQAPEVIDFEAVEGKLYGLGTYGTVYTYDFDVVKLPEGVFFHESTFIGSGQFRSILDPTFRAGREFRTTYQLGDKLLYWRGWTETVSAELGLCFDAVIDGLEDHQGQSASSSIQNPLECLTFVIQYALTLLRAPLILHSEAIVQKFSEFLRGSMKVINSLAPDAESTESSGKQQVCDLFTKQLCLGFLVLQLARSAPSCTAASYEVERLLTEVATITLRCLLSIDLDVIRKLCDDLQYLSFREAGIRNDQHAAQAWLVIMHIMAMAKIPRASFWDIFNTELLKAHQDAMNDARTLEKMWYSLFSLLPLTNIDSMGVLRNSTIVLDDWSLVVKLTKPVFQIYSVGLRQSAGFNDYLRALFSRCYHLMIFWDWKRHGTVIGPLFDFFASQKLAYLRNEPLTTSPQFLQRLHLRPGLALESRDASFHILLKIIALSFKQMSMEQDMRGVRNMVARLLPNHDRQYPKEEAVLERDLASLRNHHDILCTLFWAAPAEFRPNVGLLRNLVDPERSHKAAYLINLRAWICLSQFVLSRQDVDDNRWPITPRLSELSIAYEPFALWQAESFEQLLTLYHSALKDVNDQLNNMSESSRHSMAQDMIDSIVRANKVEIMGSIIANLSALQSLICDATSMDTARLILSNSHCQEVLSATFNRVSIIERTGTHIVQAGLEVLETYMNRLDALLPSSAAVPTNSAEEDSQDYGDDVFDEGSLRIEYIGELDGRLKQSIRDLLKRIFRSLVSINRDFIAKVVDIWALLAGTVITSGLRTRLEFVTEQGELRLDGEEVPAQYVKQFLTALDRHLRTVECMNGLVVAHAVDEVEAES